MWWHQNTPHLLHLPIQDVSCSVDQREWIESLNFDRSIHPSGVCPTVWQLKYELFLSISIILPFFYFFSIFFITNGRNWLCCGLLQWWLLKDYESRIFEKRGIQLMATGNLESIAVYCGIEHESEKDTVQDDVSFSRKIWKVILQLGVKMPSDNEHLLLHLLPIDVDALHCEWVAAWCRLPAVSMQSHLLPYCFLSQISPHSMPTFKEAVCPV